MRLIETTMSKLLTCGPKILLGALVLGLAVTPVRAETLTFVYPNEKNAFHDAAAEIVREAYRAVGIKVAFRTYPAARALQLSNSGQADGELVRIQGIDAQYPNLVRVPVSHVTAEQMVISKNPDLEISGWSSLKPYRIVFHRGYKVAEANTLGMNRSIVKDGAAALRMVNSGRMDVAIANRFTGAKLMRELGQTDLVMARRPVQADPLFHYLHAKHRQLVPKITRELEAMKQRGRFQEIMRELRVPPPIGN